MRSCRPSRARRPRSSTSRSSCRCPGSTRSTSSGPTTWAPTRAGRKPTASWPRPWPRPAASPAPRSCCAARSAWSSSAWGRTASCSTPCTSPTRCATSARSTRARPPRSEALDDRQADNWRPLLAIADEAGGAWPELARAAARTLAGAVVEVDTAAPVRLLADLRDLLATTAADRLATAAIIRHLTALEDRPWADDARGHPLTPRHLATLLEGFRVKARHIRKGADTRKGYMRADF